MPTDYENSTQKTGSVAQQPCHEEVCKKTPPSIPTGKCNYYKQRNDNYIQRHQYDSKSGSDNPPDYYLNYGFKYNDFRDFAFATHPDAYNPIDLAEKFTRWQ